MNRFALLAVGLLALAAPLAWTVAPAHAGGGSAPAAPTAAPLAATAQAGALPAGETVDPSSADAGAGTLRVRIVNEGDAATLLVAVTDASGVPRHELRSVAARTTTLLDHKVPVGKVTSEVHNGPVGGTSTSDLSRCASRFVEQNYTISAGLTGWSISVGSRCVPKSA